MLPIPASSSCQTQWQAVLSWKLGVNCYITIIAWSRIDQNQVINRETFLYSRKTRIFPQTRAATLKMHIYRRSSVRVSLLWREHSQRRQKVSSTQIETYKVRSNIRQDNEKPNIYRIISNALSKTTFKDGNLPCGRDISPCWSCWTAQRRSCLSTYNSELQLCCVTCWHPHLTGSVSLQ